MAKGEKANSGDRAGASKGEKSSGRSEKAGGSNSDKSASGRERAGDKGGSNKGDRAGNRERNNDRPNKGERPDRNDRPDRETAKKESPREKETKTSSRGERSSKNSSNDSSRNSGRNDRLTRQESNQTRSRAESAPRVSAGDRKNSPREGNFAKTTAEKTRRERLDRTKTITEATRSGGLSRSAEKSLQKQFGAEKVRAGKPTRTKDGAIETDVAIAHGGGKFSVTTVRSEKGKSTAQIHEFDTVRGVHGHYAYDGKTVRLAIERSFPSVRNETNAKGRVTELDLSKKGLEINSTKDVRNVGVTNTGQKPERSQGPDSRVSSREPKTEAFRTEREPRSPTRHELKERPEKRESSRSFDDRRPRDLRSGESKSIEPRIQKDLPGLPKPTGTGKSSKQVSAWEYNSTRLIIGGAFGVALGGMALAVAVPAGTVAGGLVVVAGTIDLAASVASFGIGIALLSPGAEKDNASKEMGSKLDVGLSGSAGLAFGVPAMLVFGEDGFTNVAPLASDIKGIVDLKDLKLATKLNGAGKIAGFIGSDLTVQTLRRIRSYRLIHEKIQNQERSREKRIEKSRR